MSPSLRRQVGRLANPRSRRSQLWACVYCGAFEGDESPDPSAADADRR